MTTREVFDKRQPMRQLTLHPLPGAQHHALDPWVHFCQIDEPVGCFRRYFVIFLTGDDTERTRFFVTNSGARSYFEHLIGSKPRPDRHASTPWGYFSVEEMKRHLANVIMSEDPCQSNADDLPN